MKIIYWVGHIGNKYGAYEKYVLLLAKICKNHGDSLIVVHEGENNVRIYRDTLDKLGVKYVSIPHTLREPIKGISASINLIKKYRPDIIHYNFTNPLLMPLSKICGVPITYRTCHNGILKISLRTRLSRILNNLFIDHFFAISKRVKDDEVHAGVRKDRLDINSLGIPLEYYSGENTYYIEDPQPIGWNDSKIKKIITIGRFFPEKGMEFITKVSIEIVDKYPDVIWWMVGGDGPDYTTCLEIVNRRHLDNRIFFLGQRNDVPGLLNRSYLQVVGSVFEGLGLNVLEASSLRVPTIGTNIPGLDEAIRNFETGFLVEPGSINSMISAISLCLENQLLREHMGESAKKHIIENFNSHFWIEKLMNYYTQDYFKAMSKKSKHV